MCLTGGFILCAQGEFKRPSLKEEENKTAKKRHGAAEEKRVERPDEVSKAF